MKPEYDIIIVGAGPAGTTLARFAACGGASVLVLEKDKDIGVPVRCAEGVTEAGLRSVLDEIDPRWITHSVSKVMFHSPSGFQIDLEFNQTGHILNRRVFDYDLAQLAEKAGATVLTKAYVHRLLFDQNRISGVQFTSMGKSHSVRARLVVGADGVESRVGRWAGIDTRTKLCDMETCAQFTARGINVSQEHLHLYFSSRIAPEPIKKLF